MMSKPFYPLDDDQAYMTGYREGYREGYDNALAEQSFSRAAVIEECARVAEKYDHEYRSNVAAAIRALKDRP